MKLDGYYLQHISSEVAKKRKKIKSEKILFLINLIAMKF